MSYVGLVPASSTCTVCGGLGQVQASIILVSFGDVRRVLHATRPQNVAEKVWARLVPVGNPTGPLRTQWRRRENRWAPRARHGGRECVSCQAKSRSLHDWSLFRTLDNRGAVWGWWGTTTMWMSSPPSPFSSKRVPWMLFCVTAEAQGQR